MTERHQENFWKKVNRSTGCWDWQAGKNSYGYGVAWNGTKLRMAHRVAFELANKVQIDTSVRVLHHCDRPSCVNPSHLFLGSAQDNTDDMMRKGRNRALTGEHHPKARLSLNDVLVIRASPLTVFGVGSLLARHFNIHRHTISNIKAGRIWKEAGIPTQEHKDKALEIIKNEKHNKYNSIKSMSK